VPSAVYRHFKGKDDVLDAVLELLSNRLLGNVAQARKETPQALDRLKSLLMRHVRLLSENRAIPHIVFSDGIYTGHPERKAKVAQIITTYLGRIQEIIEEGRQDGTVREDVYPVTASVLFLGMILPAAILWNVSEGHFDVMAHAENAWPVFSRSIEANT